MATIKDIASRLGVSTSTVSYALNGGPRQVPEPVKQKILDLARELNYRPNRVARSLVTGKTGVLGVIMPAPDQPEWAFAHRVLTAVLQQASEEILVVNYRAADAPETFAFSLLDGRLDGCIALTSLHPTIIRMLDEQEFTHASVGTLSGVSYDLEPGVEEAIEHVRETGHSTCAFVCGIHPTPDVAMLRALVQRTCGDLRCQVVESTSGYMAAKTLLNHPGRPTAIIAASDEIACGFAQAYLEAGLHAPKEYSLMGFGDTDWARASNPQLTSIRIPYAELAAAAITLAKGGEAETRFATDLVIRGSSGRATRTPITLRRFERERFRGL